MGQLFFIFSETAELFSQGLVEPLGLHVVLEVISCAEGEAHGQLGHKLLPEN